MMQFRHQKSASHAEEKTEHHAVPKHETHATSAAVEPLVVPPLPYATPALMRVHRQAYRNYIAAGGTPMV
jgi:hypothetical protein